MTTARQISSAPSLLVVAFAEPASIRLDTSSSALHSQANSQPPWAPPIGHGTLSPVHYGLLGQILSSRYTLR